MHPLDVIGKDNRLVDAYRVKAAAERLAALRLRRDKAKLSVRKYRPQKKFNERHIKEEKMLMNWLIAKRLMRRGLTLWKPDTGEVFDA